MDFEKVIQKKLERRARLLEMDLIRKCRIWEYIDKNFPKSVKLFEVNTPLDLSWLKDNQYALVLFDIKKPHITVPVIVEFDDENQVKRLIPYDDKAERRLKELKGEEK